jgi:hypothetical protein
MDVIALIDEFPDIPDYIAGLGCVKEYILESSLEFNPFDLLGHSSSSPASS